MGGTAGGVLHLCALSPRQAWGLVVSDQSAVGLSLGNKGHAILSQIERHWPRMCLLLSLRVVYLDHFLRLAAENVGNPRVMIVRL